MKLTKTGFSSIPLENDKLYINFTLDCVTHSDPEAEVVMNRFDKEIKVVIKPSEPSFKQHIIDNLLGVARLLGIKVIFSKSLALQKSISYSVLFISK